MPKGSGLIEAGETCPPRRHRGSAIVRIGLLVVGWLIVAALGLVALLRLVAWDSVEPLIVLDALTLVVYLPAWVVAAGALIARRWWLAAAAAVIVAAQLTFVAPELVATAPLPAWARHVPVVRLFDANLDHSLHFHAGYVRAIEQDRPDLVTLEEFTPPALQSMVASGVLVSFPYRCSAPAYGDRLPNCLQATPDRLPGMDRVRGRHVGALHGRGDAVVTRRAGRPATSAYLGAVSRVLAGVVGGAGRRRPVRARQQRRPHADGRGLQRYVGQLRIRRPPARRADRRGRGAGQATDMTWPNGAVVPPYIRIDHVLTGARLAVTEITAKPGFGSDHRYLIAMVAIRT